MDPDQPSWPVVILIAALAFFMLLAVGYLYAWSI